MNPLPESLTPLIQESERILVAAIAHFGLRIIPSQIVVTIQSAGRRRAVGWFASRRWKKGVADGIHEINLSAECLKTHDMGELLLHELAHAENHCLGIRDCSGQYHNKNFKAMAERFGLRVKERGKRYGYGLTELADRGTAFLEKFSFKQELFALSRLSAVRKSKVRSRLLKCFCSRCGYIIRTTAKCIAIGLPTCCCGQRMTGPTTFLQLLEGVKNVTIHRE